jgi:hypothetical protein
MLFLLPLGDVRSCAAAALRVVALRYCSDFDVRSQGEICSYCCSRGRRSELGVPDVNVLIVLRACSPLHVDIC